MINPEVSIIVPCYNQAQYLDESLQSIFDQTYSHWECIIVNDGSPDNTAEVARKWIAKDSRFIYVYKENGGVSSARNLGIKNGKGEFILTLDADDRYEVTFLEKAISVLLKNRNVGIVSSWGTYFIGDKQFNVYKLTAKSVTDFLFHNAAIGTSLFRKTCWDQVDELNFYISENGHDAWNSFAPSQDNKLGKEIQVTVSTLDFELSNFNKSLIKLVKMDVEGWEKFVLLGGKDFFINYNPIVMVEFTEENTFNAGYPVHEIYDIMQNLGYSWYRIIDGKLDKEVKKMYYPYDNLIAIKEN